MFKNLIIYRLGEGWTASLEQVEAALDKARYVECGASQEKSTGWIEPRGEAHGPLVESVGGQWILKFMIEVKAVPGSVLNRKAKERATQIEQTTGRKPGKKEIKEIKEEVKHTLLPMAFSKQGSVLVWIDPNARLMLIDASSQGRADEVVTALVKELEGFAVALVDTQISPVAAMADWLTTQEPPAGFNIDQECELKASDESKAVVRYARHPLDNDEVKQHIAQGKLPTKLALTWDDRVSFMLTEGMQVKKVSFQDVVFEGKSADDGGFDADVAIATGELVQLLPDLILALGGEAVRPSLAPMGEAPVAASVAPALGADDDEGPPF
ncbi:recombination-associated protein RdgC [Curvibacter sp. RS43]|uniref:recombination-associated protein RdgC n=1 Tax=Curvibacter microcysteis TaxID=3026419 RepID=UPI00236279C0|nr:recombination-associated protein RdgC [Curvibacter sp. RS43]MDD0811072.1 recombination-associated protein RdgC [Curvibacter sp. RS43]